MNLRGKVIPVIDLRIRFNLDKFDFDKDTCIIVVNFDSEYIGFVVDSVTEVMRVNKKMINPNPPLVGTIGQEYILGICRYNDDLVFILDIDRVVFGSKKYKESNLKKLIQGTTIEESNNKKNTQLIENIKTDIFEKAVKTNEQDMENKKSLVTEEDLNEEELEIGRDEKVDDNISLNPKVAIEIKDAKIGDNKQEEETSNIDELIKEELKKREKETEEIIRRKHDKSKDSKEKNKLKADKINEKQTEVKEEISEEKQTIDKLMEEELKKKDTEKEKKKEVNINIQNIDISELKRVAKNIIEGKEEVLDKGIGAEIASIILELKNAKAKYENFINSIVSTRRTLPKIEEHLKDINEITTKSTDTLFNVIDSFNHFYEEFLIEIDNMKKYVDEGNIKEVTDKLNYYGTSISEYVTLALKIYEALEFEDITSQKINRILKLVSDVTARFGSILGYIKNKKKTDYVLLSQEEINNILKNMGLE
jgi:hypothetical protein